METGLDLIVKYGWPPAIAVAAALFFYFKWWPRYTAQQDEEAKERREREAKQREQLDRLTTVLENTERSVAANTHLTDANTKLTEKLVAKMEALDESIRENGETLTQVIDRVDRLGETMRQIRAVFFKRGKIE